VLEFFKEGIDLTITVIGTPFEPEEDESKLTRREREERAREKYTPLWKQEFKDERGRKVMPHGAFKGGWVAGYNNTVGSAEGWTPSQFVSSRSQRAQIKAASIADFMDAEDFEEMGFGSGKELTAHADYQTFGPSPNQKKLPTTALIPEDLITPSKDPIGVRLLRLMGWREGKGIGPRKKRTVQKKTTEKKVYGVALPPGLAALKENEPDDVPDDEKPQVVVSEDSTLLSVDTHSTANESEDDSYDPYAENFTFAPDNVAVFEFKPKEDSYGLGYDPFASAPEFREAKHKSEMLKEQQKFGNAPKEVMKMGVEAAANASKFGLSVLEDADDIDIYGDKTEVYNTVITDDFAVTDSTSSTVSDTMRSGLITGFVRAKHPPPKPKYFPPPDVPRDFNPRHTFTEPPPTLSQFISHSGEIHIDPENRGKLLGETPLPRVTSTSSVFSSVSDKDKKRLEEITGKKLDDSSVSTTTSTSTVPLASANNSKNQKQEDTATSSTLTKPPRDPTPMSDLVPFRSDPEKQKRYEFWLKVQKGLVPTPVQWNDGLPDAVRQREHEEFRRVWGRFKALNEAMAKRFVSGNFLLGDHEYDEKSLNEYKIEGHQDTAAQFKMFGALTRSVEEWHPANILCRRMNIYNPYRGVQSQTNKNKEKEKKPLTRILQMEIDPLLNPMASPTELETMTNVKLKQMREQSVNQSENRDDTASKVSTRNEEDEEDDTQLEEQKPPPIDLFKAIFEASEDQKDTQKETVSVPAQKSITTTIELEPLAAAPPPTSQPETATDIKKNEMKQFSHFESEREVEIGPQMVPSIDGEDNHKNCSDAPTGPKDLSLQSHNEAHQSTSSLFEEAVRVSKESEFVETKAIPREIEERNLIHRQTTTIETQQETLNALKKFLLPSSSSKPTSGIAVGASSTETPTSNRKRKKSEESDESSTSESSTGSESEKGPKEKKERHKKKTSKRKHKHKHKHKHKKKEKQRITNVSNTYKVHSHFGTFCTRPMSVDKKNISCSDIFFYQKFFRH